MKRTLCAAVALLMALPAWAKLNAHEEARVDAMLNALAQKKTSPLYAMAKRTAVTRPSRTCV